MNTIFDFGILNSEYIYNINSNLILHIKQINHGVAMLYFTDELNNKINIPNDILVYTYNYDDSKKVLLKSINQEYALCWTDDYVVELNKNVLLNIQNQRKWNILS
jgi:hypothetical protein